MFQPLGTQAITGAIKIQHLHLGFATVDEDEILAAERIVFELISNQGAQTPERFAHVGGLGA